MFIKSLHRFLPAHITLLFVFLLASCDQAAVKEDVEEPASKKYVANYYNCGNADCATTSANIADKIKDNFHQYLFETQINAPNNPASSIPTWFNIAADDIETSEKKIDDTISIQLNTLNAGVQLQDKHRQELFHYVYPKYIHLDIKGGIAKIVDNAESRGDKTKKVAIKQANFTPEPPFIHNNDDEHLAAVYIDDYISLADNTSYLECINSIGFYHKDYVQNDATDTLDAKVTATDCTDTRIDDLTSSEQSYFSIINLAYTTDLKISFLSSVKITNETTTLDLYYGHTNMDISCDTTKVSNYHPCSATYSQTKAQSPVVNLRFIASSNSSGVQYKIKSITLNNANEDFFKEEESTSEDNTQ